jgi:hypothetical protein
MHPVPATARAKVGYRSLETPDRNPESPGLKYAVRLSVTPGRGDDAPGSEAGHHAPELSSAHVQSKASSDAADEPFSKGELFAQAGRCASPHYVPED